MQQGKDKIAKATLSLLVNHNQIYKWAADIVIGRFADITP